MTSAVQARLDPDKLIEQACELAGSDDFGDDDGWRANLDRLVDDFVAEADLSPLGVEIAAADIIVPLRNRLQITAWRKEHPEIADERIERPIVILGQPRTGTTILYDLLTQDPDLRAPLTWEVDQPVPGPPARDLRDRPAHRRNPSAAGDDRAADARLHEVPSDERARRPGMRADDRRHVLQHDLQHAVPAAQLRPLADATRPTTPPPTAITASICSTCSPVCRANGC